MSFNKLTRKALSILKLSPSVRSAEQVEILKRATSHINFFQSLCESEGTDYLHRECCQVMTFAKYMEGEVVFRYRDEGDALYIILEGRVKVSVPASKEEVRTDLIEDSGFVDVAEIARGGSFGDLALINDKPRSATITCAEACIFALLSKRNYNIIRRPYEAALNRKIEFLRTLPLFNQWTRVSIERMSLSMQELEFSKGQFLYKEGESADKIYIIKQGQLKLTKKYEVFTKPSSSFGLRIREKKNLQLSFKQANDIFGFEEIMGNCSTRDHSCICSSIKVQVLMVPAKTFFKKLQMDAKNVLENHREISGKWKMKRIENLKIVEDFKAGALQSGNNFRRRESRDSLSVLPASLKKVLRMRTNRNLSLSSQISTKRLTSKSAITIGKKSNGGLNDSVKRLLFK